MDYNGDCENCGDYGREATGQCPCGCGRWLCKRCRRGVRIALDGHTLSKPVVPVGGQSNDGAEDGG